MPATKIVVTGQVSPQNGRFWNPLVTASRTLPGKKTVYQNPVCLTPHVGNTLGVMAVNNSKKKPFPVVSKVYPESSSYFFRSRRPNGNGS